MGASTLCLQWFGSVPMTALLLFGLGIGWNISFVAATAQMADSTAPGERGKLLGFNDLVAALLGAAPGADRRLRPGVGRRGRAGGRGDDHRRLADRVDPVAGAAARRRGRLTLATELTGERLGVHGGDRRPHALDHLARAPRRSR